MKRWAFPAILAATPVLLLFLGEGGLRLFPGTGPPGLLLSLARDGDVELLGTNAEFPQRFFHERYEGALLASGRMRAEPFIKPEGDSYRVVAVGASTIQGYPHPHRLAAPAFLRAMLADALPDRHVEVFNLGITSIASFAVTRTVEQALELEPDVVIIYTGHNEFYGIYGAGGGTSSMAASIHYELLSWRLPRGLKLLIDWAGGSRVSSEQLLEAMARRGEIGLQDVRRQQAREQLSDNLIQAVRACRNAGVRPMLCTLTANDEGFAPAASRLPAPDTNDGGAWWEHLESAQWDLKQPDGAQGAWQRLQAAEELFDDSAWLAFLQARALRGLGRDDEASARFARARDLDMMPWRAPRSHNEAIRTVAQQTSVDLVDVQAAFQHNAHPAAPGWDLFVDHVHPSLRGQALLARVIAMALVDSAQSSRMKPDEAYAQQQGYVPAEGVRVDQAMGELLGSPPMDRFNRTAAQRFRQRAATGWQALSPAEQRGAQQWMSHRQDLPLVLDIADQLFADGHFEAAMRHYRAARLEAPFAPRADLWSAVQLGWCAQLLNLPAAEISTELAQALQRVVLVAQAPGVDPAFVDFVRGSLHHFLQQPGPALVHLEQAFLAEGFRPPFLYSLFPPLARELVAVGRAQDARRYAAWAAADAEGNPYFTQLVSSFEEASR